MAIPYHHTLVIGSVIVASFLVLGCTEDFDWQTYPEGVQTALEQDHFDEAERLLLSSLDEVDEAETHEPRLDAIYQNFGELYRLQGKCPQAEPLFWKALPIWSASLGVEHPAIATSLTGVAQCYVSQGKLREAEPLFKRAMAIREKAYGPSHPEIAKGLEDYVMLLRKTNRPVEADKIEKRRQRLLSYRL